jgi:hypothetical protein
LYVGKIHLLFVTVETQQILTISLLQDYHLLELTFMAKCFGRHAAIIRPVKS